MERRIIHSTKIETTVTFSCVIFTNFANIFIFLFSIIFTKEMNIITDLIASSITIDNLKVNITLNYPLEKFHLGISNFQIRSDSAAVLYKSTEAVT